MNKQPFTLLMWVYLLLAIAGLIVPWYFNLQHLLYSPIAFTIGEFFRQNTDTPMASSLTYDFLIGANAAIIWMIVEHRRLKMKHLWLYIIATFLIAFAFTFPLFLFQRERVLGMGHGA